MSHTYAYILRVEPLRARFERAKVLLASDYYPEYIFSTFGLSTSTHHGEESGMRSEANRKELARTNTQSATRADKQTDRQADKQSR